MGSNQGLLWSSVGAAIVAMGSVIAMNSVWPVDAKKRESRQLLANIFIGLGAATMAVTSFVAYVNPGWDGWVFVAVWITIGLVMVGSGWAMVRSGAHDDIARNRSIIDVAVAVARDEREADDKVRAAELSSKLDRARSEAATAVRSEAVPVAVASAALGAAVGALAVTVVAGLTRRG